MTIVFKASDNVIEKMIKYYENLRREKTPPQVWQLYNKNHLSGPKNTSFLCILYLASKYV